MAGQETIALEAQVARAALSLDARIDVVIKKVLPMHIREKTSRIREGKDLKW